MFLCTSASDSSSGVRLDIPWSGLWTVSVGVAADIVDIDDSTVERSRRVSRVMSFRRVT